MALSKKTQGHLIMLAVMTAFGLNIPINKYIYSGGYMTPFAMTTARMTFAAIAFWIVSFFMPKEKVEKKDLLILMCGGLSGMLFNQGLFAYGLSRTSPVDASLITTSSPLFAMVIAAIILKEPITFKKVGGVLLGGLGAILLIYTGTHSQIVANNNLTGDFAVLGAQLFYSLYLVITRPLSQKYSPITMMKWMFLTSAIVALPLWGKDLVHSHLFYQNESKPFLALLFVLFGATFFTYLLIPLAQRRIRATTISMYTNVQPLIASIVAICFGMDSFTIEKLVSGLFIFVGVYLVTTSKSRKDVLLEKEE